MSIELQASTSRASLKPAEYLSVIIALVLIVIVVGMICDGGVDGVTFRRATISVVDYVTYICTPGQCPLNQKGQTERRISWFVARRKWPSIPKEREAGSTQQIGAILLSVVFGRPRQFQSEDHDPFSRRLLPTAMPSTPWMDTMARRHSTGSVGKLSWSVTGNVNGDELGDEFAITKIKEDLCKTAIRRRRPKLSRARSRSKSWTWKR